MDLNSCKQFVINVLKDNGPNKPQELLELCRKTSGCPKILNSVSDSKFFEELKNDEMHFMVKLDKVCCRTYEDKFTSTLLSAIKNSKQITVAYAVDLLNNCDKNTAKYIQAYGKEAGINQFIQRNHEFFALSNGMISSKNNAKYTLKHAEAVEYFLEVLSKRGTLTVTALSGHWNQASASVKSVIKSTNHILINKFLADNSFYFELKDEKVGKRISPIHELFIKVDAEDNVIKSIAFFLQKIFSKRMQTFPQLVSCLNQDGSAEIVGTVGSKKLTDVEEFVRSYPKLFYVEENNVTTYFDAKLIEKITVVSNFDDLPNYTIQDTATITNKKTDLLNKKVISMTLSDSSPSCDSESQYLFERLFGKTFSNCLNDLLLSINIRNINKVEMLWFDLGRKPFAKVLLDQPTMKYAIHELNDHPLILEAFLKDIILKLSPLSSAVYGLDGHLHIFRVNQLGGVPVGITMFHQEHYPNIQEFEESEKNNVRVIIYDRQKTSGNSIYSYLRTICCNLSKHHHVVVVDYNGKIAGYHPGSSTVLHKARCISCFSFDSRTDALHEAHACDPDYIVTNCLDPMDVEILKLLKSFGKQGIRVVVPLQHAYEDVFDEAFQL